MNEDDKQQDSITGIFNLKRFPGMGPNNHRTKTVDFQQEKKGGNSEHLLAYLHCTF